MTDAQMVAVWKRNNKVKVFKPKDETPVPYSGQPVPTHTPRKYDLQGKRIYINRMAINFLPEDDTLRNYGE